MSRSRLAWRDLHPWSQVRPQGRGGDMAVLGGMVSRAGGAPLTPRAKAVKISGREQRRGATTPSPDQLAGYAKVEQRFKPGLQVPCVVGSYPTPATKFADQSFLLGNRVILGQHPDPGATPPHLGPGGVRRG